MKRGIGVFVILLLLLNTVVIAEEGWFSSFFSDFLGSRENIVGSASCDGFWECYLKGGKNLAGGA